MGEVYRAYDTKTDRIVALKVLPPTWPRTKRSSSGSAASHRPRRAQRSARGPDPRLRRDRRPALPGHAADRRPRPRAPSWRRRQAAGPALAVTIVEQVAAALDAAHEAGLIHRDVKPSNILVTDRDFVYLIDFGLARTASETGLTTAGSTLGTLAYMAPERFEGGHDRSARGRLRADMRAVRMPDGHAALPGGQPRAADRRPHGAPVPQPSAVDPKLAAFDEVIAKGMAKKPDNRYQTAGELAAAARQALSSRCGRGRRRAAFGRSRKKPGGRGCPGVRWRLQASRCIGGGAARSGDGRCVVDGAMAGRRGRPTRRAPTAGTRRCRAGDRGDCARGDQGDRPAGGRGECALRAQRIQELRGQDRRLRRRPDERGGQNHGTGDRLSGDALRGHHSRSADGKFNVGMSSFTDTLEREELVDFVTYFQAGT